MHLVEKRVQEAKAALATDEKLKNHGALVFWIASGDETMPRSHVELRFKGGIAGSRPKSLDPGDIAVEFARDGWKADLRIETAGYEVFQREIRFEGGEVVVWDDVVLEPLRRDRASVIVGTLWLEDEDDLEGIRVFTSRGEQTVTDARGRFVLRPVAPGETRVGARKEGFHGLIATLTVEPGRQASCSLEGYRQRCALVRWAYQPEESVQLTGAALREGHAIIEPRGLHRISFSEGFKNVGAKSDFLVSQRADELTIHNFDQSGPGGPGIIKLSGLSYEEVTAAPNMEFPTHKHHSLQPRDIFVFRTYDGKHYAKMEVLEIYIGEPPPEAIARTMPALYGSP
jgi:hypothetical protein